MKFIEGNIYFNKIIVIQSIPDEEMNTGTYIHNDTISRRAWNDPNLSTELIDVVTKNELLELLTKIKTETKELRTLPFIHFETHGTQKGLFLKSEEEVIWDEIIPSISEINTYSGNNLYISVSSCWGGNIQFAIKIDKPCPFRGFIGPMEKIIANDLLVSFTPFFNTLLTTNDFEISISSLNAYNTSGVIFHHTNCETFFDSVLQTNYGQLRNERINNIAVKEWAANQQSIQPFQTFEEFKEFVKTKDDETYPQAINILRNRFLHK